MTSDQRTSSKLLMGITTGLVAIIVLFLAYQWLVTSSSEVPAEHESTRLDPGLNSTPPPLVKPSEATVTVDEKTIQLVDETLLEAAVPTNAALAKEEVAKLEDIQSQLHDQETTLKEQHSNANDLIALKEEQIKLLEAQLAQK